MNNIFFVLTIDVEPDCSPDWHYSKPLSFNGVSFGIKNILQPLFNKYGIVPTYLINNVVLENNESVEIFRDLKGNFELGTHLHPEFIEPEKSVFMYAGTKAEANICHYDPLIEYQKIQSITSLFEKNFGYKPHSFRAGRFSAGMNTLRSLSRAGYNVDTSVTPHINWNDNTREGGIDFSMEPEQPYLIKRGSALDGHRKKDSFLEVPVSIISRRQNIVFELIKSAGGLRRDYIAEKSVWLRPGYTERNQLVKISRILIDRYRDHKITVLNMMFHNVEVLPGISQITLTKASADNFLAALTSYFEWIRKKGVEPVSLQQLYDYAVR